ncbi:hypothetical protein I3271_18375 [Photobacterium leiognathi]|uniref:hypothetical protein n=1 Tax=Photobacterium leiognathi TaxID=553611 RepID=UPI001EE14722|nr:hypothetical protein [Photobacterium leiognathi]MCG3886642.1 hypothetical protein [Photobacterium leiognathi]
MITITVSANPQTRTSNSSEVNWNIRLSDDIAKKQLRPTSMTGIVKIVDMTFKNPNEILSYAEIKALNAIFCSDKGLRLLITKELNNHNVHIMASCDDTVTALRGLSHEKDAMDFSKVLLSVATPVTTMFFGARFNKVAPFVLENNEVDRYDEFASNDISDILCIQTEIGYLSIGRRALESFTRKTKRDNAFHELASVLKTSKLTIKFQSPSERQERIDKYKYDSEIVTVESKEPAFAGLNLLIPTKPIERDGIQCFSLITLFSNNNSRRAEAMNNQQSNQAPKNADSHYENDILYVEVNESERFVSVQFGSFVISINMSESRCRELNYVDAAFMALNLMHMQCQPQKRVRIYTENKLVVEAFHNIEALKEYVIEDDAVTEKLYERITMSMYKARIFGNIKLSDFELRPLPIAEEPLEYSQINFDNFGKIRKGDQILILKPHAFSQFLKRMSPEELAIGGRNPLAFMTKLIKRCEWTVKVPATKDTNAQWHNHDNNAMLVIGQDETDNTLQIVTFFRAHRYENYEYKKAHPERFKEVIDHLATVPLRLIKVIE